MGAKSAARSSGSCFTPTGKVEFEGVSQWFAHNFVWESCKKYYVLITYANRAASIQHSTILNTTFHTRYAQKNWSV